MKTLIAYQLFLAKQNDTQLGAAVASILLPFLSLPNWLRRKLGLNRAESSTKNTAMLLFSKALDALFFVPCSLLLQVFFYKGRISGVDFQVVKLMHTNRDMIEALQRLGQYQEEFPFYCGPEMAHLLVISPLQEAFPCQLLITHPPLSERIARLERLKV